MLRKTIQIAFQQILRNPLRSSLTTLGVVIGVGSVIGMVMLGDGATANVTSSLSALGENMLVLSPGASRRGPGRVSVVSEPFDVADSTALQAQIPGLSAVAPVSSRQSSIVFSSKNHRAAVLGTTPEYFRITGHSLGEGRWMTPAELSAGSSVCVLGQTVRKELFGSGRALGDYVRVGRLSCEVVGLLAAKETSSFRDPNDVLALPLRSFQRRISGSPYVNTVYLSVHPNRSSALVKRQVELLMRERRRLTVGEPADFHVRDMADIIRAVTSSTRTMTALLGGIAAVSLLVGGIGIMNIMLVSVTERTREIGIRLAIGARATDILLQFLIESVVLSMLGGALGVGLGLGIGGLGANFLGLPIVFSPQVMVLGFAFSACVGVLFGILPARKAARLLPIEALRHN